MSIRVKNPVIYMRTSLAEENELSIASKYFPVIQQRTHVTSENDLVIPRYSSLPYHEELEKDIQCLGSKLINTYRQHCYVANLRNWYYDLGDLTPRTWFYLDQIPDVGPFILKGATNSKKFQWNTHMFATTKREAIDVYMRLAQDGMIGVQDIVVRQFVPLNKLEQGLNGLPISEEYRFFVLYGQVIGRGFYWVNYWDEFANKPDVNAVPQELIDKIISVVASKINFFVFDVAKTATGDWILIELNDGTMSGPSLVDLDEMYYNMKKILVG